MSESRPLKRAESTSLKGGFWALACLLSCSSIPQSSAQTTRAVESVTQIFRSSPPEAHKQLRERVGHGQDSTGVIEELVAITGDHSFDGLKHPSPSLQNALRVRERALQLWNQGNRGSARELLTKARNAFIQTGAVSEAQFCAYQIAETYAEEERFSVSLQWINRSLERADITEMPYLAGLLFESRGYSLWFLGDFQNSIRSFLEAVRRWYRIDFAAGITNAWNNLATLYEELGMPESAEQCYFEALKNLDLGAFPEQRFHVHRNFALFLHRKGESQRATEHLDDSAPYSAVSPDEFLLAQAEILGKPEILKGLTTTQSSILIERDLLLVRLTRKQIDYDEYISRLRKILRQCREANLSYYSRETCFLLGKAMEQAGRYRAAAEIYQSGMRQDEATLDYGSVLPYWKAVSPLFDGWIRCLIQLGKHTYARRKIQELSRKRRENARRFLRRSGSIDTSANELVQLSQLGTAGQDQVHRNERLQEYTPGRAEKGFTILEFWPDGQWIHAWVESVKGTRHVCFPVSERIAALTQQVCEYFHGTHSVLAPQALMPPTDRLYDELIAPLEAFLTTRRILLIPHKELQVIPFELLRSPDGIRWGDKHILSYLPDPERRFREIKPVVSDPLLLLPSGFSKRQGAQIERESLRQYAPRLRLVEDFEGLRKLTGRWIHVSTHFKLHPKFWPASSFQNGSGRINLMTFAKQGFECRLLSLAVCESANAFDSGSPYWLGVSELFLAQGAQSLLASRWGLDEVSAELFVDFYQLALSGHPMDEALYMARSRFLNLRLPRGEVTISGSHPYFWAGICYIGWPGKKLVDSHASIPWNFLFVLIISTGLIGALLLVFLRSR